MSLTHITSSKRVGFQKKSLRVKREMAGQTAQYMKQKSSFFIAVLSLVAFIAGNLVGQHGMYAFFHAALGQFDDSVITYTGTVPPIAMVPDYKKWATYGGSAEFNTFRQIPQDLLIPLPAYSSSFERNKPAHDGSHVYSVAYEGDYKTGREGGGSHPGIDIRVPEGTPVVSIANGIVTTKQNDANGFGLYIVIRHPHMPDPDNPDYETVLHSGYAHLSAQLVEVGDVVSKGQLIGYSGRTGDATGPHLHYQIDRDSAPWHLYWPFTGAEARQAGLNFYAAVNTGLGRDRVSQFTVNPLQYVQHNYPIAKNRGPAPVTVASAKPSRTVTVPTRMPNAFGISRLVSLRRSQRVSMTPSIVRGETIVSGTQPVRNLEPSTVVVTPPSSSSSSARSSVSSVASVAATGGPIAQLQLISANTFQPREWTTVRFRALDKDGNPVAKSQLPAKLYFTTTLGSADFQKAFVTPADFRDDGTVQVQMLPRESRTVVLMMQPGGFTLDAIAPRK